VQHAILKLFRRQRPVSRQQLTGEVRALSLAQREGAVARRAGF